MGKHVVVEVDVRDSMDEALLIAIGDVTAAVKAMYGIGTCLDCETEYDLSDRDEHCGECGTCWEHCVNGGVRHYWDEVAA